VPALRFLNPELQTRFVQGLRSEGLGDTIDPAGVARCTEEQWLKVNDIAHRIRDACFPWYFSWFKSNESTREFETYLREHGFRFELEDHGDRLVFLLPKADRDKYDFGDTTPPAYQDCSFCGKSYTEVERFFVSESAAICGECVTYLHSDVDGVESDGA
jgi:ClpX C4-type zinc finger